MALIFPFRAIRAPRDKVGLVASRSYIHYSKSDLKARLQGNPYTFLHVLNPSHQEGLIPARSRIVRFSRIKDKLHSFVKDGHLVKEEKPSLYIYKQEKQGFDYCGLISGVAIDDYLSGKIKVHEQTLTRKENLFKQYLDITRFNAEPVLLTHKPLKVLTRMIEKYSKRFSDFDFRTTDTVRHQLWVINNKKDVEELVKAYSKLDAIYIADGHHRSASSSLLARSHRKKNISGIGKDMFMALNVPEDQLRILAFDRLVKDLNGNSPKEFIDKLSHQFRIEKIDEKGFRPLRAHRFGIYMEGQWYRAVLKDEFRNFESPVDELDVQILSQLILNPILGIKDLKNDRRIGFVGGHTDVKKLEDKVNKKAFKLAFSLFPVSTKQLKAIADAKQIMPPKSTWIEPKLRSGLTIMDLSDEL